jgi:hypothetical protein
MALASCNTLKLYFSLTAARAEYYIHRTAANWRIKVTKYRPDSFIYENSYQII